MSEPNTTPVPYEVAVVKDYDLGARECDLHFSGKSLVWITARRFIQALRDHQFETVLVGDLAMFLHGYRRLTSIVEIIVTKEALGCIRSNCPILGVYLPFPVANFVRDTESQVKIRLHITGMPRNRTPPQVFLPAPVECRTEIARFPVVQLTPLIDMRLATGLDEDFPQGEAIDVIELIRVLRLKRDLMDNLHPLVQRKYLDYWTCLNVPPPKYIRPLRGPGCLESMDDPDALLEKCGFSEELRAAMIRDGLILERRPSGRAMLTTPDYDLAESTTCIWKMNIS